MNSSDGTRPEDRLSPGDCLDEESSAAKYVEGMCPTCFKFDTTVPSHLVEGQETVIITQQHLKHQDPDHQLCTPTSTLFTRGLIYRSLPDKTATHVLLPHAMDEILQWLTEISILQQQIVEHLATCQGETEQELTAFSEHPPPVGPLRTSHPVAEVDSPR
ncbi:hypothetical protein QQF64_020355 [Cirrhinus molitorella]|uniref:Uncharacterized protein n=1 Tax=Cirrhinus molitorella TaxID=172907 RepID=A0ABR3L8X8_9TELE